MQSRDPKGTGVPGFMSSPPLQSHYGVMQLYRKAYEPGSSEWQDVRVAMARDRGTVAAVLYTPEMVRESIWWSWGERKTWQVTVPVERALAYETLMPGPGTAPYVMVQSGAPLNEKVLTAPKV